jgi:exodeoxyribonuclease-3
MLRIISLNANGIRAAARRGFFEWAASQSPDFVCIQETRAQEHQLLPEAAALAGFRAYFSDARRRGYSGVALYAKHPASNVATTLGWEDVDAEGRFIQADFGGLQVASLYVPSGISGPARQAFKMDVLERLLSVLIRLRRSGRSHIVCGDFNIAHKPIDTYNPVRNASVSGFFVEERAWMDAVIDQAGWIDAFRLVDSEPNRYTWWSNFAAAWERNLGWRLDYQLITPDLAPRVLRAEIYTASRFSDHAPLTIDYDLTLGGGVRI